MPDKNPQLLRKRQQIQNVGKSMFLWVAGAAAIVGLCAVLAVSLIERITFRQEVINAKNETVGRLQDNIKVANTLKQKVRVLNTNSALLATPRLEDTEPLSVVLDALPATPNSSALGASLQQYLLNVSGVTVESLTVDPIAGVEDVSDGSTTSADSADNTINFQFTISVATGQGSQLKEVLNRLEKSIRTINISTMRIEQAGTKITLSAEGHAYYQPTTKVQLKEESKRP